MKSIPIRIALLVILIPCINELVFAQYFPPRGKEWATQSAVELGLDDQILSDAVSFAESNEYQGEKDLRIAILKGFAREPYHEIIGPTKDRGGPAGMIIKDGYLMKSWGDLDRVDMTFSVTKSYLSTVAGLAFDLGLIDEVNDKVTQYVWDNTFDGRHNGAITWHHLLTQSSDWSGTLFGQQDWADRPPREGGTDEWKNRTYAAPGTKYEYNDVRVNVLAYALLQVWRKPLPHVIRDNIMIPIGASPTWRWYGYDNSWVEIDGLKVQSVSGGGHSGGGLFISTRDHARFGLLFLNNGVWDGKQLISSDWVNKVQVSSEANESYGYMWWLNRGDRQMEGVGENIYYAAGFGGNYIVIDKKNNMVMVIRWLDPSKLGTFLSTVSKAIN